MIWYRLLTAGNTMWDLIKSQVFFHLQVRPKSVWKTRQSSTYRRPYLKHTPVLLIISNSNANTILSSNAMYGFRVECRIGGLGRKLTRNEIAEKLGFPASQQLSHGFGFPWVLRYYLYSAQCRHLASYIPVLTTFNRDNVGPTMATIHRPTTETKTRGTSLHCMSQQKGRLQKVPNGAFFLTFPDSMRSPNTRRAGV